MYLRKTLNLRCLKLCKINKSVVLGQLQDLNYCYNLTSCKYTFLINVFNCLYFSNVGVGNVFSQQFTCRKI